MTDRPPDTCRCPWADPRQPIYIRYHDEEWGVPCHDEGRLFEKLILEGAQAGLSWITILKRREGYREAFDGFDPERMARYDDSRKAALLADTRIIRNRLKVEAAVGNARALLELHERGMSLEQLAWEVVDGRTLRNHWRTMDEVPAETDSSRALSKRLKDLGFRFVGPTICYSFMQSMGLVNDHLVDCFRYDEV
ncbi:MAG: DNA-3-methyladenine glycosylase I [Gammaproteobacteria bacterium]